MALEPALAVMAEAHVKADQEAETREPSAQLTPVLVVFSLDPSPWRGTTHSGWVFASQPVFLEAPSQLYPEECLTNALGIY